MDVSKTEGPLRIPIIVREFAPSDPKLPSADIIEECTASRSITWEDHAKPAGHLESKEQPTRPYLDEVISKPYLLPYPRRRSLSSGHSSDSRHSSAASSDYLTPPETQLPDNEPVPYKPKRQSSESLTMVLDKDNSNRASRSRGLRSSRHPRFVFQEHRRNSYWWLPPKPGDAPGSSDMNRENQAPEPFEDDKNPGLLTTKSMPAVPIAVGNWSSLSVHALVSPPSRAIVPIGDENDRQRSQNWSRKSRSVVILGVSLRDFLSRRKVPAHRAEAPAKITLRRATVPSMSQKPSGSSSRGSITSDSGIPHGWQKVKDDSPLLAYIITKDDIDDVIDAIERTLHELKSTHPSILPKEPLAGSVSDIIIESAFPSLTFRGLVPRTSGLADPATTITEVQRLDKSLNLPHAAQERKSSTSAMYSARSVHEIVWEKDGSPAVWNSTTTTPKEERRKSKLSISSAASEQEKTSSISLPKSDANNFKGRRVRPDTATTTTRGWSWDETRMKDRQQHVQALRSPTDRQSVTSFPPLPPRKKTSDWFSPLPELGRPAVADAAGKLYSAGIDATVGNAPTTPMITTSFWGTDRDTQDEKDSEQEGTTTFQPIQPDFFTNATKDVSTKHDTYNSRQSRRRRTQPRLPSSSGQSSLIDRPGSAIGNSQARRRSLTRATTIYLEHQQCHKTAHLDDRKPWIKPRKDSGWPCLRTSSSQEMDLRRRSSLSVSSTSISPAESESGVGTGREGDPKGKGKDERFAKKKVLPTDKAQAKGDCDIVGGGAGGLCPEKLACECGDTWDNDRAPTED